MILTARYRRGLRLRALVVQVLGQLGGRDPCIATLRLVPEEETVQRLDPCRDVGIAGAFVLVQVLPHPLETVSPNALIM
jgi:hypothetical protein